MEGQIFTQVALIIISIIGALVSAYLVPYIKAKTNANDLEKLMEFAKVTVRCANQIYTIDQWKQKKIYVMHQVQQFVEDNLKIDLTEEQIDTIIEGLVNEVKEIGKTAN